MGLTFVWHSFRSGWWLLLAGVLAGSALASGITYLSAPEYSSTTRLFVSTAAGDDTSSSAYTGNLFSQGRVTSYAQLLSGEQLAGRVVDELGLDLSAAEVAAKVTATPLPETVILLVTVTDQDPARAQEIAASLGRQFTAQVGELEATGTSGASAVRVTTVQDATFSASPVSPDPQRNLVLGVLLGLVLGCGAAVLRARADNTVKTAEQIRVLSEAGVIGTILEDPELATEHVITGLGTQQSVTAEAYRSIRTNLQFLDVDNHPRVIVVSSALPGEGKSTLAVNLSTVLAQSGSRVTLIEADLRRPRVTKYMGLVAGAGLSNVLAGTAALGEVLQPWDDGRLTVLAAGPMPPNPSEMLGSSQMRSLLDHLRSTNDYVVIDAPPLLPVTDAAVLSVLSDGCVIAVRHGVTRQDEFAECTAVLARIDARLLGVVLNRVPMSDAGQRGYGYGYGYQPDPGRESAETGSIPRVRRDRRADRRPEHAAPRPPVPTVGR